MELLSIIVQWMTGIELLGAVGTGRATRLVFAGASTVAALVLPDALDPALAIIEMAMLRGI